MIKLEEHCYIYLHGFASSPNSVKAKWVKSKINELGHDLIVPDLNQNDFANLTLTRQIHYITQIIDRQKFPITLFGSSMGGLIATILAEKFSQIVKTVLLAPAFQMPNLWNKMLNPEILMNWQKNDQLKVFHYGENKELSLNYSFIQDLYRYETANFKRQLPSLILHGIHDDIVPIKYSQDYLNINSKAKLIELNDDHSLEVGIQQAWFEVTNFCSMAF